MCSRRMLLRRMDASSDMRSPVFAIMKMACCASSVVCRSMCSSSCMVSARGDSFDFVRCDLMNRAAFLFMTSCFSR